MSGISFKKSGLDKVIRVVNKYKYPQELLDRIMVRLCELGADTLRKSYLDGMTGESAASVDWNQVSATKWEISAHSEGLLYLEFGAGITRNQDGATEAREHLDVIDIGGEPIVEIGTYGQGKGSQHSWYAPPIKMYTVGTRARHGFANAITAIYANVDQIVREEMSK